MNGVKRITVVRPYALGRERRIEHRLVSNPGFFAGTFVENKNGAICVLRIDDAKRMVRAFDAEQDILLITSLFEAGKSDILPGSDRVAKELMEKRGNRPGFESSIEGFLDNLPDLNEYLITVSAPYPAQEKLGNDMSGDYPPTGEYELKPQGFELVRYERKRPGEFYTGYAGHRFFSKFLVYGAVNLSYQLNLRPEEFKSIRAYRFYWEDLDDQVVVYIDSKHGSVCLFQGARNDYRHFVDWKALKDHPVDLPSLDGKTEDPYQKIREHEIHSLFGDDRDKKTDPEN